MSIAKEQQKTKPKLEEIISTRVSMDEEAKQIVYAFLDYCNAKNITYKWNSANRWNLNAKGKSLGYIGIGVRETDDNSWSILLNHRELWTTYSIINITVIVMPDLMIGCS